MRVAKINHMTFDSRKFEMTTENAKCLISKPELQKSSEEI